MEWLIGVLGVLILLGSIVYFIRRYGGDRGDEIVSIVMLRNRPRRLTEADVRGAVRRAWQGVPDEPEVLLAPPPDPPTTNAFVVSMTGTPAFFIIDAGRPYEDDPGGSADRFEDVRVREAYAGHRAWISVDVCGGMPPENIREAVFAMLGRIAAELIDDGCVLLYAPALGRVGLPSPETEEQLRSEDPLAIFNDPEVNTPISSVDANDRRINRAMEEARRQWPRFVEVWERAGEGSSAMVKGRFTHAGGNEYMWLEVRKVDAVNVTGVLVNEPAHVKGVRKGESIRIAVDDVVDWACVDGEEPVGLFVERVLRGW